MTGTALVPVTPTLQWLPRVVVPRPDPSFVTQLIANAEHVPQAGRFRRASPADARIAYCRKGPLGSIGARTRQVA
jgi:hypothetical protein